MDAILHVLRCFEDGEVAHVEGSVDPVRDIELVETELLLADIAALERRVEGLTKRARGGDADAQAQLSLIDRMPEIHAGRPARSLELTPEERGRLSTLQLLSAKPVLYVCNVDEDRQRMATASVSRSPPGPLRRARHRGDLGGDRGRGRVPCPADRLEYLHSLGSSSRTRPGDRGRPPAARPDLVLHRRTEGGRAWTIRRGTRAQDAAGVIHTDFKRGFISAEVASWDEFVRHGGEGGAREAGRLRQEGRDYIIQDGEVVRFRFNV